MYYEHRNYLPSVGLALAVIGLCALLPARAPDPRRFRGAVLAVVAVCALLAWSTQGRVATWRSKPEIVANALAHHPDSLRARQTQAFIDLSSNRYDQAVAQMRYLTHSPLARRRMLARIDLVSIACLGGRDPDPAELRRALADRQPQITLDEVLVADLLAQASAPGRCPRIGNAQAIAMVTGLLDAAPDQPDRATPKRQLRFIAALLYARAERWPEAQAQAERAWSPQAAADIGDLLVQACVKNGQTDHARRVLGQLAERTRPYDRAGQARLIRLETLIANR
jgi:thioredoxin-like negative regulator of GroEL